MNKFQITDDNRMVYNLRKTEPAWKGAPEYENDVTVGIHSNTLTPDQIADVARAIKKALDELIYP